MNANYQKAKKAIFLSIIGNFGLATIKFVGGFFGNSFALIADAIESLTDVVSSFLVFLGLRYANRPADENHPYGHGKAEALVTFGVVFLLVMAAFLIAHQSITNIQTPHQMPKAYTLYILGGIILVKEIFYRRVSKTGKETNSTVLEADAWHHRSDAITSLAAFIGISIALIMGEGWESADDWAALFASGFIIYNAYLIFRPALGEVMDEHLYDDFIEEIRSTAEKVEGVISTEKCYVRKHGMFFVVDLHVIVDGKISVQKGHDISHVVKDTLLQQHTEIQDVLIHIEPDMCAVDV